MVSKSNDAIQEPKLNPLRIKKLPEDRYGCIIAFLYYRKDPNTILLS